MKHTSWPWRASDTGPIMQGYSQPIGISGAGGKTLIAGVFGDVAGGFDTCKANAKLIAVAPEMADWINRVSTFTGYLREITGPDDSQLVQDSREDADRFLALLAEGRKLYAKATAQ